MKIAFFVVLGLLVVGGLTYFLFRRNSSGDTERQPSKKVDPNNNPYNDLRGQVFSVTPDQIGLSGTQGEEPFAIVMDLGMAEGTATLVAVIDGNASMYLSSGDGIIGGYGHENVRSAAIGFVRMGRDYVSRMDKAESFPLPKADYVRFYVLTNKGKYSAEEEIDKIESEKSDWGRLFFEGNKVITELRLTTEQK